MKKLIVAVLVLLGLFSHAYAEEIFFEKILDLPTVLYEPSDIATFTLSPEQELYNQLESQLLSACPDNAMTKTTYMPIFNFNIPFVPADSEDEEAKQEASVIDFEDGKITQAEVYELYTNLALNHPEIGNLITGGGFQVAERPNGELVCYSFVPSYRPIFSQSEYDALATDTEKKDYLDSHHDPEKYLQGIEYAFSKAYSPDMTPQDAILSFHDYLIDSCSYSPTHQSTVEAQNAYNKKTNYLVHSPYSALVGDRITVCQGYALAFKLLCNMAGIDCGYAMNQGHIWNIVELDGNYYHFDLTWDDPTKLNFNVNTSSGVTQASCRNGEHVMHTYAFMTDREISQDHFGWSANRPECTDDTLREWLFGGQLVNIMTPLYWKQGNFYFDNISHYYDSSAGNVYHNHYNYLTITGNSVYLVNDEDYLPNIKLEAEILTPVLMSEAQAFVAIDGTPNTTARLYATEFSKDGKLLNVDIVEVSFDRYGKAVAEIPATTNKLMLFENGSIRPIAYAR